MPMNVLLVCKRTSLQAFTEDRPDPGWQAVLKRGGSLATSIEAAHREHLATVDSIQRALDDAGVSWRRIDGSASARRGADPVDLIVPAGGDGTFLEAARLAGDTPLLGVNTDPARSVGRFCGANRKSFARLLRSFVAGRLRPIRIARLRATSGERTGEALNDLLVAHASPASTSSYVISAGRGRAVEKQRSSGLWISTAAGSTGAIRSAGGRVMPLRSRRVQFLVREPYRGANGLARVRLRGGFVEPGDWLELECRMTDAVVYFDGGRERWRLGLGDALRVALSPVPCHVLAIR